MKKVNTTPQEDKLEWQTPSLEIIQSEKTEGDPTTSDDGLGDGLFS